MFTNKKDQLARKEYVAQLTCLSQLLPLLSPREEDVTNLYYFLLAPTKLLEFGSEYMDPLVDST
jgi:hypothetical protein